ncbi:argininosuccinate lyase [Paracandidimonas soli]|uniref:Argininosuccinate lyase n=1 Tax=Paracandidimonas soli TaxID=1917182 RepID=A0A4R3VH31_9BURK|nr:argininosuccinate lyase [Paracandidimonas soli]TCV03132.1 argininosuccinate lyase [Paracandidimonas soli]
MSNSAESLSHSRTLAEARLKSAPSDLMVKLFEQPHLEREVRQFHEYLQVDIAHTIMLAEQNILEPEQARLILAALQEIVAMGPAHFPIDPLRGSFLLQVESHLFQRIGESIGGRMHTGRSRLDQGPTVRRLYKRRLLLEVFDQIMRLQEAILRLATKHSETLMPGYTCMQHAHPTTFGHYLLSFSTKISDDFDRLRGAFARLNLNPLGAAGLSGTAWPINRMRTTELLAFDGIVVNSKLAREAYYAAEVAAALSFVMSTLNDLATDFHLWSSHEFSFVETADEFCGTSSIFPQKKNPAGLEVVKFAAGTATTWLTTALATFRAEGTGDVVMRELPLLDEAFATTNGSLQLMAAMVESLTVHEQNMACAAGAHWSTATNLADLIVRDGSLSFREAHSLVARLVRLCTDRDISVQKITSDLLSDAARELGIFDPGLSTEAIRNSFDARTFVNTRTSLGGTAAAEIASLIEIARIVAGEQNEWLSARHKQVETAEASRKNAAARWLC